MVGALSWPCPERVYSVEGEATPVEVLPPPAACIHRRHPTKPGRPNGESALYLRLRSHLCPGTDFFFATNEVFAALAIHRLMSFHDEGSDVSPLE
jgi:hypothetical protein